MRRYDDGLTLQFCVSFIGRSTEWRRYKQNFNNNSRWLVLERNTIYQIPSLFFCSLYVLLFCFVFLLFHEWIWYAFSILCYIELNAHDWPYHFCFLFSSAQMIYSICMLSASRAWNHNINDPYAKQMLERQSHKITLSHPGGDSAINFTHVSMLKCSLYYWYDAVADADDDDDNNRTVLSAWQKRRHEYS